MSELREKLLEAHRTGNFLLTALGFTFGSTESSGSVSEALVLLHNEEKVDLIEQFKGLFNNHSSAPDFFLTRHLLESSLPRLNASVPHVMECVAHLVKEAGQDMAANSIFSPFIDFCAADPSRAAQAIELIKGAPDLWMDFIPPVIVAGARSDIERYFEEAIGLSSCKDIEIYRRAIYSIGRIQYGERHDLQEKALDYLERIVNKESDDHLLANIIKSICSICMADGSLVARGEKSVDLALSKGGDYTFYAASEVFGLNTDKLSEPLLTVILRHLPRLNPQNKGTVDMIDHGVVSLLKREDPAMGIEFLETLLLTHIEDLSLKSLNSVVHTIYRSDKKLLNKLLTRWFLISERVLCTGVSDIVGAAHGQELHLEIDMNELSLCDFVHFIFLARKAIGYLFLKPITAANIIISMMRQAKDADTTQELGNLLFNPLLLNFSGALRDFLTSRSTTESGQTKDAIQETLNAFNNYLNGLKAVGNITEMHPYQDQREAQSRHCQEEMSKSFKEAMKGSVINFLCTQSVILYGNKSINYIQDSSGQYKRMEIPMTAHGTEIEVPRQEHIDPIGLDYMLRIFRVERFVQT